MVKMFSLRFSITKQIVPTFQEQEYKPALFHYYSPCIEHETYQYLLTGILPAHSTHTSSYNVQSMRETYNPLPDVQTTPHWRLAGIPPTFVLSRGPRHIAETNSK